MLIEPITPIDSQPEGMILMMTTTDFAASLDTTPRELRKFLRSADSGIEPVGKGARYALPSTKRDINALSKRFTAWSEAKIAAAEAKAQGDDDTDAPDDDATA
jgi:hypothetical protein